jgi:hypothetical protein
MPNIEFSDEEHAAVTAAVRRAIDQDKYPRSPRLAPLRGALAKLGAEAGPKLIDARARLLRNGVCRP